MSKALTGKLVLQKLVVDAVARVSAELVAQVGGDAPDPGPRHVPRDLRLWLARLRLLEGVPFGYLVPDAALLPPESIRFFHVDRGWTDSLVEGALSIGTVTTAERAALEEVYATVRKEVDEAERLVRLPGAIPGAQVPTGAAGSISGFLLRSRMVSGWPALHVRAYELDNLRRRPQIADAAVDETHDETLRRLGLLRLERLAPAVLLALFDGVPQVVHVEEPRAGIQFGVDESDSGGRARAEVLLRSTSTGERLDPPAPAQVPFRRGAPGVLHLQALTTRMRAVTAAGLGDSVDAAEFALQMLQFPYRAVFADRTLSEDGGAIDYLDLFRPRLGFAALEASFRGGSR